jgi:hypothetical protein
VSALMGGVDGFPPGHLLRKKSALEELKALKSVVSNSLRNLSPLFHEGGQTFELINLAILPSEWVAVCRAPAKRSSHQC